MIRPLNELTKKNIPFKWTKQCQRSLDYVMQVIATNPILVYPDPDTQYFLKRIGFLWNRKVVVVVDKLSSTSVDFIRSERELEKLCLYGV